MVDYAQNSLLSNESELHRRQGPNYICYTQFNVFTHLVYEFSFVDFDRCRLVLKEPMFLG